MSLPSLFLWHLAFEPSQKVSEQHLLELWRSVERERVQMSRPCAPAPDGKEGCFGREAAADREEYNDVVCWSWRLDGDWGSAMKHEIGGCPCNNLHH